MLGSFFEKGKTIKSVTGSKITKAVRDTVKRLGLNHQGLAPELVASHSLRAGGAMAMHLNGLSDNCIKKMGRWSSDTFLMYIHEQISAFSKGISKKMSTHIQFHNIAFQPMIKTPVLWGAAAA